MGSPSLTNSTKATKKYWGNSRGIPMRRIQKIPISRSNGFSSQREGFD
jgi:hypothetical protein